MSKDCGATYQSCCLYFTANSLSRFINSMAEDSFKITGLSPSYAHLMLILIEEPGQSQNELSHKMNLKASTMTRFIDKLIGMNFVERVHEGRTSYIYPTESGKKLKPIINKALGDLFDKYCEILGKDFAEKLTADINIANNKLL
ncbi:MAG: MarR family transcriptional regulator [Marinifilaceae bacterium]|jgi:DNA-binding MarR family transcriptional regulator|nr:MarR family transcriptional regulator [Marinifilaceae bacterium]